MDSLKGFIGNLMLDVDEYLSYIDDYGKPNYKYFNFVLNKLGIMYVFLYKSTIFGSRSYLIAKFIDSVTISLKQKFVEEKSTLRRSALVFLLSKIFFTDDVASTLKLRIIAQEWKEFNEFIIETKSNPQYQDICLMLFHLYTENHFRFTIKAKTLALDYGLQDDQKDFYDSTSGTKFWNEIENEITILEHVDVVELDQLSKLREKEIDAFEQILPEKIPIDAVFEEIQTFKEAARRLRQNESSNVSRKEILQICRDFMKVSGNSAANSVAEVESDIDLETLHSDVISSSKKKAGTSNRKSQEGKKNKKMKGKQNETSDSDEETVVKTTNRKGYQLQRVAKTINPLEFPEKLKNCYE